LAVRRPVFWRKPVIVCDLIFILLHVISSSSVNSLLISFIRIVASISLLLLLLSPTNHTS
jgi:hypothetical protein